MSRTTAAPTLFRVLFQQRRWTTWEIFAMHFDGAMSRLSLTTASGSGWEFDGQRVFDGTALAIHLQAANSLGNGVRLPVTDPDQLREFLRPVRRELVLGTRTARTGPHVFVPDALTARKQLRVGLRAETASLIVPNAHQLDERAYGILRAIANIDDASLANEQLPHAEHDAFNTYLELPPTAPSHASIPGLTSVGAAWIGSYFCYRHLADAPNPPVFWTHEQYGESSVGWLLWAHKHWYLREIEDRFARPPGREVARKSSSRS